MVQIRLGQNCQSFRRPLAVTQLWLLVCIPRFSFQIRESYAQETTTMLNKGVICAFFLAFTAAWGVADGGKIHQVQQPRPISLGTSGGNVNDRTRSFCCSGTLGALVTKGGNLYILSNNHVLGRLGKAVGGED